MQSLTATAARQAGTRAAECRQRADQLANHSRVSPEDVRRAQVALQRAIKRAAKAQDRYTHRHSSHAPTPAAGLDDEVARDAAPQPPASDVTALRRQADSLGRADVFLHYFALGGHCTEFELDAFVHAALELPPSELTVLAHAMWEMTEF